MKRKKLVGRLKDAEKNMVLKRANSMNLRSKIFCLFLLFIAIVFILMWLLEVVFLQSFYPIFKKSQTVRAAKRIEKIYTSDIYDNDEIQSIAINNNACVEIIDADGTEKIRVDVMNGNCLLHGNRVDIYILLDKLSDSENGEITLKMYDSKVQSDVIVHGIIIGGKDNPEAYLLVDAALAPVGTFISIIKQQTFYIIAILLVIALAFSVYISDYIAKPIRKLTKSAENLAHGDYGTKFEGGSYYEVDKLAQTLEYAESELQKTDKMQRDLIANTSHDLRTPLTMMKAYAEMIRDISGNNPEKRNKHLEIIIDETDRLTELVNDMLDLSKLESGTSELEYSEFDISEKMESIYSRYVEFSKKKDFHIFFEPQESRTVNCDEGKIERVICNLINNAINYTAKEKNVYLREIIQDDGVLIEVEDTGDGIEKDKINLIFNKYYRSENHKRETVGTGLGLSIVKTVLQMHGYKFGVRSKVGVGSTFWFKISDKNNE